VAQPCQLLPQLPSRRRPTHRSSAGCLEASGQADNTVIIFTSDHGEMGGAHHLRQKGSVAFRKPSMCLSDCRSAPSRCARTDAVGSHLDLVPTILAFAGLPEAGLRQRYPSLKGHDLSGVVENPTSTGPRGSSGEPVRLSADLRYDRHHRRRMA